MHPSRTFSCTIRRCSLQRSRYRWTITSSEGRYVEHALQSYATAQAAIEAGQIRLEALRRRDALGYTVS